MSRPLACDNVLIENRRILLILRKYDPGKGLWALPGGHMDDNETAEECAIREMKEETGLDVAPVRVVGVYSDLKRDPKRKTVAIAYLVKRLSGTPLGADDASEAKWFELSKLPKLAFDHGKIISDAIELIKKC